MDTEKSESGLLELGLGVGLLAGGLYLLLSKCFSGNGAQPQPQPQPGQVVGYGYAWQPNTPFNNLQFRALTDTDGPSLYLMVDRNVIGNPEIFFENNVDQIGIIFPLQPVSNAFIQAMQGITNDANLMQRLEGFLRYTHSCLDYIYATPHGPRLLNGLAYAPRSTYIKPTPRHNQTAAGSGLCFVARVVIDSNLDISQQERVQLIGVLEAASGARGDDAFQWLANQINRMPLYSLFEQAGAYPPAFLLTNQATITWQGLQQWFTTGSNCQFVQNLRQAAPIAGVVLLNFVRNAVIVCLYQHSPPGVPSSNAVSFDTRNWSNNNVGDDRNENTLNDRPPAIGLAHELIHAYYNATGMEPGRDMGHFSTTLFELLCSGLGPWANNQISENDIRQAWPPANVAWPAGGDQLNNRAVPQRTVYVDPGQVAPANMRNGNGPI